MRAGNRTPSSIPGVGVLLLALGPGMGVFPGALSSQEVPDTTDRIRAQATAFPVLPRGAILMELEATSTAIRGVRRDGSLQPLGEGSFFLPGIGPDRLPELTSTQLRFRELMGEDVGSTWGLDLGATGGRIEADEQRVDFRIGYGVLDRVTLGLTIPTVRRRINPVVRLEATGATVGSNPTQTAPGQVSGFLSEAAEALADLEARVEAECAEPSAETRCQEGQQLLDRASGFLAALEDAYQQEILFPLRGSEGGQGILDRWAGLRLDLADWQVATPGEPPLAGGPLSEEAFASAFVHPGWGQEGFPNGPVDEFMGLGDLQAHVVVGLVDLGGSGEGMRIRSSAVASARFATGTPDSLQLVAPFHVPDGVSGVGLRVVTDVASPSRFAALVVLEGWRYGESETTLLAPDPAQVLGQNALARIPARWTPGSTLRVRVTPRVHVVSSLSLGLGYEMARKGDGTYDLDADPAGGPFVPEPDGSTLHRLRGEFRYHGFEGSILESLPFPLEIVLAYDAPIGASGSRAPDERRVELGIRVLRRR